MGLRWRLAVVEPADTLGSPMRALVVTNMYPTAEHPARGSFVRDQVEALRDTRQAEVELFAFEPGSPSAYAHAAGALHRRARGQRFDVVHAHFGLTAWPALAVRANRRVVTLHGTDLSHPRSRTITLAALRAYDLVAVVSESLAAAVPRVAVKRPPSVLPCGVDVRRFYPVSRVEARAALGLDPEGKYLLFPADPAREEKRYDRALELAGVTPLLVLRDVDPREVRLWINAANAVIVPSEREGFGLSVLEALACDVPVLATPVGVAPDALAGVEGVYCGPFELASWRETLAPHLAADDPRIAGRARAERFSNAHMAERVLAAWRKLVDA